MSSEKCKFSRENKSNRLSTHLLCMHSSEFFYINFFIAQSNIKKLFYDPQKKFFFSCKKNLHFTTT